MERNACSGSAWVTSSALRRRRIRHEIGPFELAEAVLQMLSHATTRDWLIPYADGMLAVDERRREAQAMAANHKPLLAENSLRDFRVIVDDAAAALKNPADPKKAKEALHALHLKLDAVERENANRGDDDQDVKQLIAAANVELDRI